MVSRLAAIVEERIRALQSEDGEFDDQLLGIIMATALVCAAVNFVVPDVWRIVAHLAHL